MDAQKERINGLGRIIVPAMASLAISLAIGFILARYLHPSRVAIDSYIGSSAGLSVIFVYAAVVSVRKNEDLRQRMARIYGTGVLTVILVSLVALVQMMDIEKVDQWTSFIAGAALTLISFFCLTGFDIVGFVTKPFRQ